jgi:alkanesulfonate monooxygenase SsuD/methylene tetrahydromethanopterin reductase-like flavin-dependent oxidoreductase (luciferase family)
MKALWQGGPVTLQNSNFNVRNQIGSPDLVQRPHPPLLLGGGGPKMLAWAAVEADIVSIIPAAAPGGGLLASDLTIAALVQKVGWVREAAGQRFDQLTLNTTLADLVVTNNRRQAARDWLAAKLRDPGAWIFDRELTEDEILSSPFLAFGTHAEIATHLQTVCATTGVSYYTVFPHLNEAFGPALAHLRN